MSNIKGNIRRFVERVGTQQIVTFIFFLVISTSFWFLQALNEVHEAEFDVPVDVEGLPRGVVLTSDVPQTIHVTLRDRNVVLLGYRYGTELPHFTFDASLFTHEEGTARLLQADILKRLKASLPQSTQVVSIKPDTIHIYYNHGRTKRVPLHLVGRPSAASGYSVTHVALSPDSVDVVAPSSLLDTLTSITFSARTFSGLNSSFTKNVALPMPRGMRARPAEVRLQVSVDRLVEKKMQVQVHSVNVPKGMVLRTFPAVVELACQVPMSQYRRINAEQFSVVVDFATVEEDGGNKCMITVQCAPAFATHVRLSAEEAEYVLEKDE